MNFEFYLLFLIPAVLLAGGVGYLLVRRKRDPNVPENSRSDETEPRGLRGGDQHRGAA